MASVAIAPVLANIVLEIPAWGGEVLPDDNAVSHVPTEMALARSLSQPRNPRCKHHSSAGLVPWRQAEHSGSGRMGRPVLFTLPTSAHCPWCLAPSKCWVESCHIDGDELCWEISREVSSKRAVSKREAGKSQSVAQWASYGVQTEVGTLPCKL